jgi:hypothetical protein
MAVQDAAPRVMKSPEVRESSSMKTDPIAKMTIPTAIIKRMLGARRISPWRMVWYHIITLRKYK